MGLNFNNNDIYKLEFNGQPVHRLFYNNQLVYQDVFLDVINKTNFNEVYPGIMWRSSNHDDNSMGRIEFRLVSPNDTDVTLIAHVDSEEDFDWLKVFDSNEDEMLFGISGSNEYYYTIHLKANIAKYIDVIYDKDGSVDEGADCGTIQISNNGPLPSYVEPN